MSVVAARCCRGYKSTMDICTGLLGWFGLEVRHAWAMTETEEKTSFRAKPSLCTISNR